MEQKFDDDDGCANEISEIGVSVINLYFESFSRVQKVDTKSWKIRVVYNRQKRPKNDNGRQRRVPESSPIANTFFCACGV